MYYMALNAPCSLGSSSPAPTPARNETNQIRNLRKSNTRAAQQEEKNYRVPGDFVRENDGHEEEQSGLEVLPQPTGVTCNAEEESESDEQPLHHAQQEMTLLAATVLAKASKKAYEQPPALGQAEALCHG